MNRVLLAGTTCSLTLLVLSSLPAQQDPARRDPTQSDRDRTTQDRPHATTGKAHFVELDEFLGAEVRMPEKSGDSKATAKGEVDDLIVGADGKVRWVVLDVGGFLGMGEKEVAVPISAFDCRPKDDDEATVTVSASEEQLKKLPEIDLDEAEKTGLGNALRNVDTTGKPAEGNMKKDDTGTERREARDATGGVPTLRSGAPVGAAAGGEFIRASKIDDWKVHATDGEIGKVSEALLRIEREPTIGYLVVALDTPGAGSTDYLIPFQALSREKRGDEWVWSLGKTKVELQNAVKYVKPSSGVLDEATSRRADEFFGVTTGGHGTSHDGTKRSTTPDKSGDGR